MKDITSRLDAMESGLLANTASLERLASSQSSSSHHPWCPPHPYGNGSGGHPAAAPGAPPAPPGPAHFHAADGPARAAPTPPPPTPPPPRGGDAPTSRDLLRRLKRGYLPQYDAYEITNNMPHKYTKI